MTASLGFMNLIEQLPELRETLMFTSLLKNMIKETDEQLDEEMCRMRSGRVPVELGWDTLLVWMCLPSWKLSELHTILLGFYGHFLMQA